MIVLRSEQPFAHGGNRLCFVHPADPAQCIKVRRPEFSLEDMRRAKGFPHTLFPASRLDESIQENALFDLILKLNGEAAFNVLARNFGFVETDMGPGLCSELIRDDNGRISLSVMQYLWENSATPTLMAALDRFEILWSSLQIPARALLLHNIVAQRDLAGDIRRLVVIDGLGVSGLLPYCLQPRRYRLARAHRKVAALRALIPQFLEQKERGMIENKFWMQLHDGLSRQRDLS